MQIGHLPRVRLAALPTPLDEAARFSKALRGPRILIKRDDNTGLAMGGNKARKLEFLMGEALAKGVDVVLTTGAVQSNHARMTIAAANKLGIKTILVLRGDEPQEVQGNLLLDRILGAEIRVVKGDYDRTQQEMESIAADLRRRGHTPMVIPVGGATPSGSLGYVTMMLELVSQLNAMGLKATHLVHASGSGGTQAGLILGAKALNTGIKIVGISVSRKRDPLRERVAGIADEASKLVQADCRMTTNDAEVYDEYIGEGYGIPTKECVDAIKVVAETEGILLDPVYTSKAMAGLIDLVGKGKITREDTVVFLHTGGTPALFAYRHLFLNQAT
jgi:D-cysteine desulfhydrase family pyridoxal phosphate-dependent enzyme